MTSSFGEPGLNTDVCRPLDWILQGFPNRFWIVNACCWYVSTLLSEINAVFSGRYRLYLRFVNMRLYILTLTGKRAIVYLVLPNRKLNRLGVLDTLFILSVVIHRGLKTTDHSFRMHFSLTWATHFMLKNKRMNTKVFMKRDKRSGWGTNECKNSLIGTYWFMCLKKNFFLYSQRVYQKENLSLVIHDLSFWMWVLRRGCIEIRIIC